MRPHTWRTALAVLRDQQSTLKYGLLSDPQVVSEGIALKQFIRVLGDELSSLHWDGYVTLTFRWDLSYALAKQLVESWLEGLGPDIYAYIAYEQGEANLRTHVHVLLTILPGKRPYAKTGLNFKQLRLKWAARTWTHGNVKADVYDPRRGAAFYVSKFPNTGEFYGRPRRQGLSRKGTR